MAPFASPSWMTAPSRLPAWTPQRARAVSRRTVSRDERDRSAVHHAALPAMMRGVLATAAIWLGIAAVAVAAAGWRSTSLGATIAWMVLAAALLAAGTGYVFVATRTSARLSRRH